MGDQLTGSVPTLRCFFCKEEVFAHYWDYCQVKWIVPEEETNLHHQYPRRYEKEYSGLAELINNPDNIHLVHLACHQDFNEFLDIQVPYLEYVRHMDEFNWGEGIFKCG